MHCAEASTPSPRTGDADAAPLWTRWREDGDTAARERLIGIYLPYARMLAATLYARRTHDEVAFDDYLQLARIGLLEAIDRFDPGRGVQFKTFASKRIQGSVLSGLVRLTELNQQLSVRGRLHAERIEAAKEAAGGTVPPTGPDALFRYLADVGIGLAVGILLEDTGMVDAEAYESEARAPSPEVSYFRKAEVLRLRAVLRDAVDQLPAQQKSVIGLHYLQEMPFEQVALRMQLTRGRIAQLHRQALARMRGLLEDDAHLDLSY